MKKFKTGNEMASSIVGDGKSPNIYFVTIGYGWYFPYGEDTDMIQVKGALDSVSIPVPTLTQARDILNSIGLLCNSIKEMKPWTIGQVLIEDRKTGVIFEKCLQANSTGHFTVIKY